MISNAKRPRRTKAACSSSDVERSDAQKHARAVISSASGQRARSSNDFERVFEGSAERFSRVFVVFLSFLEFPDSLDFLDFMVLFICVFFFCFVS